MGGEVLELLRDRAERLEREALESGIKQGLEQGLEQGIEQGIEQGRQEGVDKVIALLRERGVNPDLLDEVKAHSLVQDR